MTFVPNPAQRDAANALAGRVLIAAGAGSGKTRTLTDRFLNSLRSHSTEGWTAAAVDELLTITFTDKAAGELADRIRQSLRAAGFVDEARTVDTAWISTIHGVCSRILHAYALEAGIDPTFSVADTVQTQQLMERAFEDAAVALIEAGKDELFGEYEYDALYLAATELVRDLRTRGLDPRMANPENVRDAHAILHDALNVYGVGREDALACDPSKSGARDLLDGCERVIAFLDSVDASALAPARLAREVWKALSTYKPKGRGKGVAETVSWLKDDRVRLMGEAAAAATAPLATQLIELAVDFDARFQEAKATRSVMDFDDLQVHTRRLLDERPDISAALASRFRLVMVDEFQDTDALQLSIIDKLAGENLCTVGDEQQSIYRFRGADIEVYRAHNHRMLSNGARAFKLELNYRSHPAVLEFVNHQFEDLFGEDLIKLQAGRHEGASFVGEDIPRVSARLIKGPSRGEDACDHRAVEADVLASAFARLRDDQAVDPADMVILLRTYTHADEYAEALQARGFEVSVVGGSRFFQRSEVALARAILSVIANPHHDEALMLILESEIVADLEPQDLWTLGHAQGPGSLWQRCEAGVQHVDSSRRAGVIGLLDALSAARAAAGTRPVSEVFLRFVEDVRWDLTLLSQGGKGKLRFANVLKLASMADAFEAAGGAGVVAFATYLDAKERYREHTVPAALADDRRPAVRIMSIHASKGLEFPVVALPELGASGRSDSPLAVWEIAGDSVTVSLKLPTAAEKTNYSTGYRRVLEDAARADSAETKRLYYVACTRAREVLMLSAAGSFSKDLEKSSDGPATWLRAALGLNEVEPGLKTSYSMGRSSVDVAIIDAPAWEIDPPVEAATVIPEEASVPDPPLALQAHPMSLPRRLSYSDLARYESCGLGFWATKVLKLGSVSAAEHEVTTDFGSAAHALLQLCDRGVLPENARIEAIARSFRVPHDQIAQLTQVATAFLASELSMQLGACEETHREWPFALNVGDDTSTGFTLVGSIDAYGRSGDHGLVVDYKTGTSGEHHELIQRYRLQASAYALAALSDGCSGVSVVFTRPEVLDTVGTPQEVRYEFTGERAPEIVQDLMGRRARMLRGEFEPLDSWEPHQCERCPAAGGLCPVPPPRGWF